jgi:hypothetical protein
MKRRGGGAGGLGTRVMEQGSWYKTSGAGQAVQDSQDRSAKKQSGLYSQERKQRTGWPDHDSQDRKAMTQQWRWDNHSKTVRIWPLRQEH